MNAMDNVFEVHEPGGKVFRVFADGRTEGFADGAYLVNGFLPLLYRAASLAMKAVESGLISAEEGASFLL